MHNPRAVGTVANLPPPHNSHFPSKMTQKHMEFMAARLSVPGDIPLRDTDLRSSVQTWCCSKLVLVPKDGTVSGSAHLCI
jgi:hypothetical protein